MAATDALPRQPDTASIDTRVVKALGHPTRVRILALLRDREMISPVQLSAELEVALGTVGYHVRRLESLGFIELAKRTQRRGAVEHHYRACTMLEPQRSATVEQLAAEGAARRSTEASAIADEAQAAVARGGFDAVAARSDLRVMTLDEEGQRQLKAAIVELTEAIERAEQASAMRLSAAGSTAVAHDCTAVTMLFACVEDG